MPLMSVTEEVSHEDMSPLKAAVLLNMWLMSFTKDRSGTSVALYTMLVAPAKAPPILFQDMFPH